MSVRHTWARLREDRAASPGRHSPDYLEKRTMPASPAASPPLASERPETRRPAAVAVAYTPAYDTDGSTVQDDRKRDPIVDCGFCHVSRPSSQMVSLGGGQFRCDFSSDWGTSDDCVQRYLRWEATGAKPAPILSSPLEPLPKRVPATAAEAVLSPENEPAAMTEALAPLRAQLRAPAPVLPPAQEAALTAFNKASDEQDAAEAGQDRTEDGEPPEAAEEPPAGDGDGAEAEDGGEGK